MFGFFTLRNKKSKKKMNKNQPGTSNSSANKDIRGRASTKRPANELSPENNINRQISKVVKTSINITRSRSPSIQSRLPDYWLNTGNRYDVLSNNTPEDTSNDNQPKKTELEVDKTVPKIPKPPPLFVHGVGDIKPLIEELKKNVESRYVLKTLTDSRIKIILDSKEDYKKMVELLNEKKTEYHSFRINDDKTFRVVLKGVHPTTDINDISESLNALGHTVIRINGANNRKTGKKLPIFFIDLEKNDNNKKIFDIKRLLHMVVSFEAPTKRKNEIPQCQRCQRYGHTKNYCHLGPRCVKCPGFHLTSDCPRKTKDESVKCVNCEGAHPANYKGCKSYQDLRTKLRPIIKEKQQEVKANEYVKANISYASHLSGPTKIPANTESSGTSNEFAEMMSMMKNLMANMTTMMNLLTAVISKLN